MVRKGEVRDQNVDYLMKRVFIPAIDVVKVAGTTTLVAMPASLSVGWSIGSPSYGQIPGSRYGGIVLTSLTPTIDYFWRVPYDVDKNHAIYFRHHWTSSISGLTPSIGFTQVVATLSSASVLTSSPTAVLNVLIPVSANTGAGGTAYSYNLTGRGSIQPIATGLAASQAMDDRVEAIHVALNAGSANWSLGPNNVWWLGMDIEYTPHWTFGDGSRREGRKTETNLGFQEVGAASNY